MMLAALCLLFATGEPRAQSSPRPVVSREQNSAAKSPANLPHSLAPGHIRFAPFNASPFPYGGIIPDTGKPFLDVTDGERRGHTSPRGGVLWEKPTYSDKNVLLFIPKGFDPAKPGVIVLFLHGNLATLERDVASRQQVPAQLAQSKLNAVLVAPQFASNALDSSAGHFWDDGNIERFVTEASFRLAELYGDENAKDIFARMPLVIVAYSGGYLPAAYSLKEDSVRHPVKGVILLDALFGETDKFLDWIKRRHANGFFVSAFSQSSRSENLALRSRLEQLGIPSTTTLPSRLDNGSVVFIDAGPVDHNNFVSQAWIASPLRAVLLKVVETRTQVPETAPQPAALAPAPTTPKPSADAPPGPYGAGPHFQPMSGESAGPVPSRP